MSDLNIDNILIENEYILDEYVRTKTNNRNSKLVSPDYKGSFLEAFEKNYQTPIKEDAKNITNTKQQSLDKSSKDDTFDMFSLDLEKSKELINSAYIGKFLEDEKDKINESFSKTTKNASQEKKYRTNFFDSIPLINKRGEDREATNINFAEYFSKSVNQMSDDSIETLKEVFSWLFDNLELFSTVYDNYQELFNDIEKLRVFKPSKQAPSINVEKFLYNYRAADALNIKINLLAMSLGNYNFHLIADCYKNAGAFFNLPKRDFLEKVTKGYNGNEFDISYLQEFKKLVEADISGKYVFNDLQEEKEEDTPIVEENKLPKKKSIFSNSKIKKK